MLIKDPYLYSNHKNIDIRSNPPPPAHQYSEQPNNSLLSQPVYPQGIIRNRAFSGGETYQLKGKVKAYQKELRTMQEAYIRQQQMAKKMNNFHGVNREYHEAMRLRNFQLNSKLRDAVGDIQVTNLRSEEDHIRYTHEKDLLFKKYQDQTQQLLRLRANCNAFLQQKTRLEEEISHLTFMLEKQAHQHQLQAKEQMLRMESLDRTYKTLVSSKDEQIKNISHRLRIYEDQNRKLADINKTLQLTKEKPEKIDHLSQIHHPESHMKSYTYTKENKENEDYNAGKNQLKEQKTINQELRKDMANLKKELEMIALNKSQLENQLKDDRRRTASEGNGTLMQFSKWQGLIASIATIRQGINKQVFEMFFKSVRDGEKRKQNSLVIFIQNWKNIDMERLQPYIKSYFEARNNLKQIALTKKAKESVHYEKIEEILPIHVSSRPGRNNINQWILSTIQFTKNQKESTKKSLNNFLLFLFRLLTIKYRINYPMQGKSYHIDSDVKNELMHEIIKGLQLVFKHQ